MRVIIADDEKLVRIYLCSILQELDQEIEIVAYASNGEDLVKLAKLHQPDIAFVDIKMPIINGLDAIKEAKPFCTNTQWVVLSGISDFSYAKEAIQLGVITYLLKPISIEELSKLLNDISEKNKIGNISRNFQFENEVASFLLMNNTSSYDMKMSIISRVRLLGCMYFIDSCLDSNGKEEFINNLMQKIRQIFNEHTLTNCVFGVICLPNGNLLVIGAQEICNAVDSRQNINQILKIVENTIFTSYSNDFYIRAVYTDWCDDIEDLHKKINQIQNLSSLRILCSESAIYHHSLLNLFQNTNSDLAEFCNKIIELNSIFEKNEYLQYMKLLDDLSKLITLSKFSVPKCYSYSVHQYLKNILGCDISPENYMNELIHILKNKGEELLTKVQISESYSNDLSYKVIEYIEQNYMSDISLGQIATQLNITPSYLSNLFHKKMNTTFLKCLTQYRMLKAKELLANPKNNVKQVAESVGYYSTRHFTKLFKETYGCYPSEYKKGL